MGFLISPGVEVNEIDITNSIAALSTSVGAYAGPFKWGPVGTAVTISSEKELAKTFGSPTGRASTDADNNRSFFTAASFLKYGNALRVARSIDEDDALNASSSALTPTLIKDVDELSSETGVGVYAKYPGAQGNNIKVVLVTKNNWATYNSTESLQSAVSVLPYEPNTTEFAETLTGDANLGDEVHVVVIDVDGTFSGVVNSVLETFPGVSLASNAKTTDGANNYISDVINRGSQYVYAVNLEKSLITAEVTITPSTTSSSFTEIGSPTYELVTSGGADGSIGAQSIITALDLFSDAETIDVNFIFAHGLLAGDSTVNNAIRSIVESRKDVLGFISAPVDLHELPSNSEKKADVLANFADLASSSYLVLDNTTCQMYNRYNDSFVWVPSSGHTAGLCANTDFVAEPWFSPAGYNRGQLRGVVKIAYNPNQADRDDLYKARINSIVSFPGQGILLYGDKTALSRNSAFSFINVRRLFITLEKAIANFAKFQLFELNDEFTRSAFRAAVEPYLRNIQGRRGIIDYSVVCDTSNNTPEVIDSNSFVADIYIKPSRSINAITLNFIATRSGVEFKEIVGA